MADENISSDQDVKGGEQQTPSNTPDDNKKPELSPAEIQRREEQSRRDREAKKEDNSDERLSYLEAREMERARDEHVRTFLTENSDKFPNVKFDDPMFKYAGSKEEVEEIATNLQNRYIDLQQDALRSVQVESDVSLTDEEIAQKEIELEKESVEQGRSTFTNFIENLGRRKKG